MAAPSPSPESLLHLITLHHLAHAGFASTSQAASLTLTSALEHYLLLVARTSAEKANGAGRSKVGAKDLVRALNDLGLDGVEEIHEFTVGLGKEVEFVGYGTGLRDRVEGGVEGDTGAAGLAELSLVEEKDVPEDWWDEDEDEEMDIDGVDEVLDKPIHIRHTSPDMSWLPPLPGSEPEIRPRKVDTVDLLENAEPNPNVHIDAPTQSIANRYLKPISYASSQHSQSHTFHDPPSNSYPVLDIPPQPTSFPALIKTYEQAARDPSIASSSTSLRLQASRILQTNPDTINPSPSFSPPVSLPPPRSTPYIPPHSETLPIHSIPLHPQPHPSSILNPLLHTLQSANLPATLRDRLTSIRPPVAQIKDDAPLLYGDRVGGPDIAALAKVRGKPDEGEEGKGWLRYTWDVGPRGIEKWGKWQLPVGRRVVQWGEGEDVPRMPGDAPAGAGAGVVGKVKLKFVTTPGGTGITAASPGGTGVVPVGGEVPLSPAGLGAVNGEERNGVISPSGSTPSGIKLRWGGISPGSGISAGFDGQGQSVAAEQSSSVASTGVLCVDGSGTAGLSHNGGSSQISPGAGTSLKLRLGASKRQSDNIMASDMPTASDTPSVVNGYGNGHGSHNGHHNANGHRDTPGSGSAEFSSGSSRQVSMALRGIPSDSMGEQTILPRKSPVIRDFV